MGLQKAYGVDGFKFDTRFFDDSCRPWPGFTALDYVRLGAELTGAFAGIEQLAAEAISLARLACEVGDEAAEAEVCRSVLAALDVVDDLGGPANLRRGQPAVAAVLMALCVARTPDVPLPPSPEAADVAERTA